MGGQLFKAIRSRSLSIFFVFVLIIIGLFITGSRYLNSPLSIPSNDFVLLIPLGSPLSQVVSELAGDGVLKKPIWFTAYARVGGAATRIQSGEYLISKGTTPRTLLRQLIEGGVLLHQFTMIEGQRFSEMLIKLRAHPAIDPSVYSNKNIMEKIGKPELHWEGQFLPDTYSFPRGSSDLQILTWSHQALEEQLARMWEARAPGLILKTPQEALTLGSIIEKETAMSEERARISGVFHRRLELGMRLQSDPTVIYGIGESFDGNIRRSDLNRDTPYNTYTRGGLPPTPIGLVGQASLDAALTPSAGTELYFVATGLPDGSHHFSVTLEEHNQAVSKYLESLVKERDL